MSRVDELQKKYPNLPREIVVKWEVLVRGVKDTSTLDKVSYWTRGGSYQSRDLDISLKEIAAKREGEGRPGYVARPKPLHMKNGIGANIRRGTRTPYEIRDESEGKFALYEGDEKVEDVYFPSPRGWGEEMVTSRGTPVTSLVEVKSHCFSIQPIRFCEYFVRGEQCKFCNYNSTYDDARSAGTSIPVTINLEDTVEAYKMLASEIRFIEGSWQSGALTASEKEAATQIKFVEAIANAAPHKPIMRMSVPPLGRKDLQRLHDAGLTCFETNIEVWGAEIFAGVCPGKNKYKGFERYKETFQEAVDIYGVGNVCCNFVAGVSMMPENGHKTWQESRDSMIEGFRWLTKNGAFPFFIALRLGVGSPYGDDKSNWDKLPPMEYYLDSAIAHHELMTEYGYYDRLNRLMLCPLCPLTNGYNGEIGMLELAGDIGSWAAPAMPEEANWLARFIDSVKDDA
ncbi:MAG: hypothetical protein Q7O66_18775 [Dehalococcoidia bacterium]|nr:hypothetical protein [Dehalococcoidia bacterium]